MEERSVTDEGSTMTTKDMRDRKAAVIGDVRDSHLLTGIH